MTDKHKLKVFLSYSHVDEKMKEELDKHLTALKSKIETWNDRRIIPGKDFEEEIKNNLKTADVFIPLVSSDFLSSFYCTEIELAIALERRKKGEMIIIPVVLRSVDWQGLPISKLLAAQKDAKPIVKWEHIDDGYLDAAKGIRIAVEDLLKNGQTQNAMKPVSETCNTTISNLGKHPRNPNFTGRDSYFDEIKNILSAEDSQPVAIHGLGGIGKTQLALEYARRNCDKYDVVWWLRSETKATLDNDLKDLGMELSLPLGEINDRNVVLAKTINRLSTGPEHKLLIFNNVENRDKIKEYIPHPSPGTQTAHIIITSRSHVWGNVAKPLKIDLMTEDEAVQFLTKNRPRHDEIEVAGELAHELGCLPLALAQARAYIEEKTCSIARYIELFKEHKPELLNIPLPEDEYEKTILTTWEMSFNEAKKQSPTTACLMNICAFLAPDDIPLDIFTKYTDILPEPIRSAAKNNLEFEDAIAALLGYSLIERNDETISIHRLVQVVTRNRIGKELSVWAAHAATLMFHAFNFNEDILDTWPDAKRHVTHAVAAAQNAFVTDAFSDETGGLFNNTSTYFRNFADFDQAKTLAEKAIITAENVFKKNDTKLATAHDNLGYVLKELGDLKGAKENHEKALNISTAAYGENHPDVARDINNVGSVLFSLGDLKGAKKYCEKALSISRAIFGEDHPQTQFFSKNLDDVIKKMYFQPNTRK